MNKDMTMLTTYLLASAIILFPVAHGFFGWYVNIEARWCNDNLQQCASRVCDFMGLGFCLDSVRIQINYDVITPHLCTICNKRCRRVPRDDGRYDDRLPCDTNLDCLMGQKCRDGGCWNWKQLKNCTRDWQCDRRQYSCQSLECRLRPVDGPGSRVTDVFKANRGSRRRCINDWDEDCLPVMQGQSCTDNYHCDMEYICYNGQCVLPEYKPKQCFDKRDCNNGYVCRDRECVKYNSRPLISSNGESCDGDSDCPNGQSCKNFFCSISTRRRPKNSQKRKSCEDTSQCPSGQRCFNLECVDD